MNLSQLLIDSVNKLGDVSESLLRRQVSQVLVSPSSLFIREWLAVTVVPVLEGNQESAKGSADRLGELPVGGSRAGPLSANVEQDKVRVLREVVVIDPVPESELPRLRVVEVVQVNRCA